MESACACACTGCLHAQARQAGLSSRAVPDLAYLRRNVVPVMAMGVADLKRELTAEGGLSEFPEIHQFLDGFYLSRIGIRILIGQHIALHEPQKENHIGAPPCSSLAQPLTHADMQRMLVQERMSQGGMGHTRHTGPWHARTASSMQPAMCIPIAILHATCPMHRWAGADGPIYVPGVCARRPDLHAVLAAAGGQRRDLRRAQHLHARVRDRAGGHRLRRPGLHLPLRALPPAPHDLRAGACALFTLLSLSCLL